jgi:hypothetical protein
MTHDRFTTSREESIISSQLPWPNGARCVVAVTFDMDADSLVPIHARARAANLISTTSMLKYAPTVGVPRILGAYRKLGIRQTLFVPPWYGDLDRGAVGLLVSLRATGDGRRSRPNRARRRDTDARAQCHLGVPGRGRRLEIGLHGSPGDSRDPGKREHVTRPTRKTT